MNINFKDLFALSMFVHRKLFIYLYILYIYTIFHEYYFCEYYDIDTAVNKYLLSKNLQDIR